MRVTNYSRVATGVSRRMKDNQVIANPDLTMFKPSATVYQRFTKSGNSAWIHDKDDDGNRLTRKVFNIGDGVWQLDT